MVGNKPAFRLMPWTWSLAWMLTAVGAALSDIYSSPSRSLIAYIALSVVGWGAAGYITARISSGSSGMAVQLVAWAVAYLVAIPVGLAWITSQDMPPFLLFVPFVLAGAIGGVASSLRTGVWKWVSGILVGLAFFLFSTISFYAGYFLLLIILSIAQRFGPVGAFPYTLAWALPEALFGLLTGFLSRWLLALRRGVLAGD